MKLLPLCAALALASTAFADPLVSSWITGNSTKYARIYQTDAAKLAGTTVATWTNGQQSQGSPAYCGVQEIAASASWVYVRSTGLGSHTMGPWYNDASRTTAFVNLPVNQKEIFRVPRTPTVPGTKSVVQNEFGIFVDGVHGFDSTDATSYSTTNGRDGDPPGTPSGVTGNGIWNRDAFVNEAITFDTALAHQQNTGVYHYHANPIGPRYLLGDHVDFNATTKAYSESTGAPGHSPIIGWAKDGYPIYGPYGYGSAMNAASTVRRMVCGYVPRDGANGTTNLASTGRQTIPAWAGRVQNRAVALTSTQYGPAVSSAFPLGRYIEDNDYLGDLGKTQGVNFDLDEYNGRLCVTPEYSSGTYAYFVAITSAGVSQFPYNVGKRYYGSPTGGYVTSIAETVTTFFSGGPSKQETMVSATPNASDVTVVWSSTEGGTYKVEGSSDLTGAWSTLSTTKTADANAVRTTFTDTNGRVGKTQRFYRVTRTALAAYDDVSSGTTGGGSGILTVSPTSGARGTTVGLTINLDPSVNPPPQNAPINSATIGTINGTNLVHVSATQVTGSFTIPAGAALGAQTVSVTFPGPPGNPTATVTYTLTNGFTVTPAGLAAQSATRAARRAARLKAQ